jgi:C4-type Zn-finger protein
VHPADFMDRVGRKACPECGHTEFMLVPSQMRVPAQQGGSLGFTVHICRYCGYVRWFVDSETFQWLEQER